VVIIPEESHDNMLENLSVIGNKADYER
jgi:hypothetical protein